MDKNQHKPFIIVIALGIAMLVAQLYQHVANLSTAAPAHSQTRVSYSQLATDHPFLLFQKIPINSAEAKQFELVPGIGPTLSQRIVAYRQQHGPFKSLQELAQVKGIGPHKLKQLNKHCSL